MRKVLLAVTVLGALSMMGCKRQVPRDIIQKSIKNAMSFHAPLITSAMCGQQVRGIPNATITVTKTNPDNTGVVHIKGSPWPGANVKMGTVCEGDVEYKYSYTSKKRGRTTTTTWYLDHAKLTAVQTPGVTFKPVDENASDGDEGDNN